ncbi:MAG: SAF domain-containing protein [Actinomycetota bacterium]|nr:SAF domain-containing protein [Actinomycetota bacterium]
MAELPTPQAKRLQRPSWRDPRLLVGVILVLLSSAVGARVVASADDRVAMYAAAQPIKPGDRLTADNLTRVDVQLGDRAGLYLSAAGGPPGERYALRPIPRGELVPVGATGSQGEVDEQPVMVSVVPSTATTLRVGSLVDVWVSPRDPSTTQERYLDATKALERVTVSMVPADQGRFGAAAASAAVQILVPREKVHTVIAASDRLSRFTLVPVPGSTSGS